jgi:putative tricarboxylic transport membrane protein
VGMFARVLMIPPRFLMPIVAMVSFVGIYGISGSTFDLQMLVLFGVLGWVLRKLEVPLVPVIIGVLLGNLMEANLRRALTISNGDWTALFDSPLSIGLWIVAIIGFLFPILFGKRLQRRMRVTAVEESVTTD